MSLDLDSQGKKGLSRADVLSPQTGDLSTISDAIFTVGVVEESTEFHVYISASTGNITLAPGNSITGIEEGDTMKVIKVNNQNKIIFTDPITGLTLDFANKIGESYTLKYDGSQWIFNF